MSEKPRSMSKECLLKRWKALKPNMPIRPVAVPYKHSGSTYGEDGIRIDGSIEFIDSVLSRIQDLLEYENETTRLSVSYSEIAERSKTSEGVTFGQGTGTYCCYIRVAQRGNEAKRMGAFLAGQNLHSIGR